MAKKNTIIDKRLSGKVAIVFGGNGDIGGAIAKGFCRAGATVVPTGRNKKRLSKITKELASLGNSYSKEISVDVNDSAAVKNFISCVKKDLKQIDIMVYASGIYIKQPAEKLTSKDWNNVIQTNLSSAFFTSQEVGKIMLKQGFGNIITIGSLGSFVALTNTVAYSVSKAGICSLTKCLASEWASRNVRVNCIIPGVFPTRLNEKALSDKKRVKNILRGIPNGKLGKLEELVGSATFLASDEASYVNGVSLPVDGGFLSFSGY